MGNDERSVYGIQQHKELMEQRNDGNTRRICSHSSLGNDAFDQQAAVYSFKYIHSGSKPVIQSKNGLLQLRASRRAQD